MPKLSTYFGEIFSRTHENSEEQNKVLQPSIIIINYRIIIINTYNYTINALYDYYVPNIGLLKECNKEPNVAVTGATTASCFKRRL
jgi:hypothetical protein